MVRVSYDQKPYRRALMEAYGATGIASPSNQTQTGRAILAANPNSNGSLVHSEGSIDGNLQACV